MVKSLRRAFSLVECMVVIAIVACLAGLVLAGIGRVREAANRLACANNLKQIGMAVHHHYATHGLFPSNGGWDGRQYIENVNGSPTYVSVTDFATSSTFYWGVGDPTLGPREQTGSWAYAILPYVDQQSIFAGRAWTFGMKLYCCPSRRLPTPTKATNDANGSYEGGGWQWGHIDYAANAQVVPNRPQCFTIEEITDGSSNTILVGEKALSPLHYYSGTWYWDEPFFTGGSGGTQRGFGIFPNGAVIVQDDRNMGTKYRWNWGSAHGVGCNFLLADGSLRTMPFESSAESVWAFLTPDGGEPVK